MLSRCHCTHQASCQDPRKHGTQRIGSTPVKILLTALSFALISISLRAQDAAKPKEIIPKEALVIRTAGQAGRSPVHTDAVEAEIVAGTWKAPKACDQVESATWEKAEFNK